MSDVTIRCDQAIFTSIRTPMGEGYRIVAASRTLHADEKQAITKASPSHEGLCDPEAAGRESHDAPSAVAFYPLPSGRACIGLSCAAGSEHTGRGGRRVYTHCAVFDPAELSGCAFNLFNVVRSMVAAGLTSPQLKPPNPLPELSLTITDNAPRGRKLGFPASLNGEWRRALLQAMLEKRNLIINIKEGWLDTIELLLMGFPGPLRADLSFAAGLRFSLGRQVNVQLLHDGTGQAKARAAGQQVEYLDPCHGTCTSRDGSAWLALVERHWSAADFVALDRRTSRRFDDCGAAGRERVARLYNSIDEMPQLEVAPVIQTIGAHLTAHAPGVEAEINDELLDACRQRLLSRFGSAKWAEVKPHWRSLLEVSGRSANAASLLRPAVERALRCALRDDPLDAAFVALDVAGDAVSDSTDSGLTGLFEEILSRLAALAPALEDADTGRLRAICTRWERVRPACPILHGIAQYITAGTPG